MVGTSLELFYQFDFLMFVKYYVTYLTHFLASNSGTFENSNSKANFSRKNLMPNQNCKFFAYV